ncbi:MAG: glycosyltransferase family 2 protein [Candidatus Hodarchaeota archaeon]
MSKAAPKNKFAIVIPAHNEELFIADTVKNLFAQHYPRSLYDVIVVADNCSDKTAQKAYDSGAIVQVRNDKLHYGKGYVIHWILDKLDTKSYDTLIISDADTHLSNNFLYEINQSMQAGSKVIQSYYTMSNPQQNLFTTFFSITNTIRNLFYFWAKWKSGFSVPLVGSGMCFDLSLLKKLNWTAFSITEDHEYFAFLADKQIRIDFCPRAKVFTHHSVSFRQATTQRLRWYGGKFLSMYRYGFNVLLKGIRSLNILQIDAGLELLIPHLALLLNINLAGLLIIILISPYLNSNIWFILLLTNLGIQILYFGVGLIYTKNFRRSLLSIILVPVILVWGLALDILAFLGFRQNQWIRSERNA